MPTEPTMGEAIGDLTIEASQGYVLAAMRKRFDRDAAFSSTRITVWYETQTQWYWIYASFPSYTPVRWSDEPDWGSWKMFKAETKIKEEDLAAMTGPSDFRTLIDRAHQALRNRLRDALMADDIRELPSATRRGGAVLLDAEPTEETREEVMALLYAAAGIEPPG